MTIGFKKVRVRTWHLKFNKDFKELNSHAKIECWDKPNADEYLELYSAVGKEWGWSGRLLMTKDELVQLLQSSKSEIWLMKDGEQIQGFFELDLSESNSVEIVYLGLIPEFIGKGLGKKLLNAAITKASKKGANVWLHTCEFDHENALAVYQKAGFEINSEHVDKEYYPVDFLIKKGVFN